MTIASQISWPTINIGQAMSLSFLGKTGPGKSTKAAPRFITLHHSKARALSDKSKNHLSASPQTPDSSQLSSNPKWEAREMVPYLQQQHLLGVDINNLPPNSPSPLPLHPHSSEGSFSPHCFWVIKTKQSKKKTKTQKQKGDPLPPSLKHWQRGITAGKCDKIDNLQAFFFFFKQKMSK